MKLFICTYTHRVKSYCDEVFFKNFSAIVDNNDAVIVDNTLDQGEYYERLKALTHNKISVRRCICPPGPHQFLRNVTDSVNMCRNEFLTTDCDHMLVIESDVLPPTNILESLKKDIDALANEKWGMIGGLYYQGFHDFNLQGLLRYNVPNTVLSGCTLYNGELIRKVPFRWDITITGAFPDAFMSYDSNSLGYSNWNDHAIICGHAEKAPGDRGQNEL